MSLTIVTDSRWRAAAHHLDEAARELPRDLTVALEGVGRVAVEDARGRLLGASVTGNYPTGVRERIASSLHAVPALASLGTVKVSVTSHGLSGDDRILASAFDKEGGWNHPVYGNPGTSAHEDPKPWLRPVKAGLEATSTAAVEGALQKASHTITRL